MKTAGKAKRMLKVRGILVDLDGTLVDSREAYYEAFKIAIKTIKAKNFDIHMAFEIPKRLEQNKPINDLIPEKTAGKFLETYLKTYYGLTEKKTKMLPNVQKTLEKLSAKTRLALITMRYVPKENIIRELEKFGLAKYFNCVTTALDTSFPKPSPEALIKSAEQIEVEIGECAVVGDSVADVKAGKNAGAKTVAVLSGIFTREELEKEKPDLILNNINELLKFIG